MTRSIAIVSASGRFDGITFSLQPYPFALKALGYEVEWYQCQDRGIEPYAAAGCHFVEGPRGPGLAFRQGIGRLWTFPRRLRNLATDILLVADPTLVGIARHHTPAVAIVHDLRPFTPYADRWTTRWMFRYALPRLREIRRIIVPTHVTAKDLGSWGILRDRVRIVPETHALGLHPEHIPESTARLRAGKPLRVLCVSTDRWYKNIDLFLRIAESAARRPSVSSSTFTLVSQLRDETARAINERDLRRLRVVPSTDSIADEYRNADVLVHPSLYEGFGRPIAEAMAFGMPVLARPLPTVREVSGTGAFFIDTDSPDDWLTQLESLADPVRYQAAAGRALERGQAFLPERFRDALGTALEDL